MRSVRGYLEAVAITTTKTVEEKAAAEKKPSSDTEF
jgi:hypothetical protein